MNENEIMNLVAEEGFIKSPRKVRDKANSTIDEYIEEFDELINKIRMKHDKALPMARSMGNAISDDTIDKSKKDLEKILRRYRSLSIEKLEDLKEQVEDIKNPLKAEEQGQAIIKRADEIHDERFSEIKEFLDNYKPIWLKELATESVEDGVAEEEVTDNASSVKYAKKLGDRIAAIKQLKPHFENTKTRVLSNFKSKLTQAHNKKGLDEYIEGLQKSEMRNIKSKRENRVGGEDHMKLQVETRSVMKMIGDKCTELNRYKDDAIKSISEIMNMITYKDYCRSQRSDRTTATEGAREIVANNPELNTSAISNWIKKRFNELAKEENIPSVDEYVSEITKRRNEIKSLWETKGSDLVKESESRSGEKEKEAAERADAEKKHKESVANADKAAALYKQLEEKLNNGEIDSKVEMLRIYKAKCQEMRLPATASYTGASEAMTAGETAFFVGGMVVGHLLYKGFVAKREDVSDKAIPGAKVFRYLLNDEFMKAEKDLKKMMSSKKTFEVNKMVAREILSFKNEYYRSIAYTINKFLDYYDRAKPELFKEKKYYFDSPNTVRDEAIYKKITLWRSEFYAAASNEMNSKAMEIVRYTPAYDLGTDCDTIRVDAKFLNDILNVDKTFAVLKEIEKALGDLPDPSQIRLYNEHNRALSQYHLPVNPRATTIDEASSPLHAYIMYEYLVAEKMKQLRDMFIHYIAVVYDILNYTRYVDDK